MKKYIILIFSLIVCLIHIDVYAGNRPDYKTPLTKILNEPRIYFEPEKVETMLERSFADPLAFNLKSAVSAYDALVVENQGYMSVDDLFYVCLAATNNANIRKTRSDWHDYMWDYCKYGFILPLIKLSEEEVFIDESVVELYDGTKFNQECTEPRWASKEEDVLNMVCTTGKYKDLDPAFEKAMITKFRLEGGCKDVHDGNGMTCFGVASKYYPNVKTRADAEEIAHTDFYTKHDIDKLPDAIRGDVFMALWGTGKPSKSIGLLQIILGVEKTNKVDEATISAARKYKGNLRKRFLKARWELQKDNGTFSNGWAKAFLTYLKNGCHSRTETPLLRTKETMDECKKHL